MERKLLKDGKEILGQIPEYKKALNRAVTREEYELLREITAADAATLTKYIDSLYSEVNDVMDHSFSLRALLDEVDKVQEARSELLSIHNTCHDVLELDDTLHYLAYKEALEKKLKKAHGRRFPV